MSKKIPFPDGKFSVIYADPAWTYKVWSKKGEGRTAASHYDVMALNDIKRLPVAKLADKDCALFMWATYPNLKEAFEVLEAWGFTYKTVAFTWVKKNKVSDSWFWGMGYWTRANAEICLLATKGKPKSVSRSVHQVVDARIERHSKKPDEVRERIVKLMGDVPRVELFARQRCDGWAAWGNEVSDGEAI
jgi:N6-adenosine-specific RNA methylase IME4